MFKTSPFYHMVVVPSGTNPIDDNSAATIKSCNKRGVGIDDEGDLLELIWWRCSTLHGLLAVEYFKHISPKCTHQKFSARVTRLFFCAPKMQRRQLFEPRRFVSESENKTARTVELTSSWHQPYPLRSLSPMPLECGLQIGSLPPTPHTSHSSVEALRASGVRSEQLFELNLQEWV